MWVEEETMISDKFFEIEESLRENHLAEIEAKRHEFENNYKKEINPSAEELNLQKMLERLVKMKK